MQYRILPAEGTHVILLLCSKKNWMKRGNLCLCLPIYILSGVTEINTNTLKHIYLFLQIYFQVFVSVPNLIFLLQIRRKSLSVQFHEQCERSSFPVVEAEESIFYSGALCQIKGWHECVLISVTCRCKMKNPQQWWCKEFEKRSCKTVEKRTCSRTMRGQMKTRSYFLILRESWRETVNDGEQVFMSCLRLTESVSFLLSSQAQVV